MVSGNHNFSDKHGPDEKTDPLVKEKITQQAINNELPCAIAFNIAKELNIPAKEIGKTADLINYRLTKCQLGLFGYTPEKKIVKPQKDVNPDIEDAIQKSLIDNRLSCETAWHIAERFRVHKMTISATCEHMGIKINTCQLGAF